MAPDLDAVTNVLSDATRQFDFDYFALAQRVESFRQALAGEGEATLELSLEEMNLAIATYDAFKQEIARTPEITQCYTVTGDEDFILIGHFPDMVSYDDWINARILTNAALSRSTTHVVYRRVKFETAMPV